MAGSAQRFSTLSDEHKQRVRSKLSSLTPASPVATDEHCSIKPDGETCWHQWTDRAIFDDKGRVAEFQGVGHDITERKHAENALRENQSKLTEALQIARLAYWEYDSETDLFTFNDQFYSILRTTAGKEGGYTMESATYARRFVHPDDALVVGREVQKALAASDANYHGEVEHRSILANGDQGYAAVHIRVEKNDRGRTIKTHGVYEDITERKRSEESIRILAHTMQGISEIAAITDLEDRLTFVNDAFVRTYGYERS